MQSKKIILSPIQKILGEDFNPVLLRITLKKSLPWIILFFIISVTCSYLYLRYKIPIYESSATIMIKQEYTRPILDMQSSFKSREVYGEVEVIKSKEVIGRALKKLPLQAKYFQVNKVLDTEVYLKKPFNVEAEVFDDRVYYHPIYLKFKNDTEYLLTIVENSKSQEYTGRFGGSLTTGYANLIIEKRGSNLKDALEKEYYFFINKKEDIIDELADNLEVYIYNPDANTIKVSVKDEIPEKATHIVNAVCEEYIKYDLESRSESASMVIQFIDDQLEKAKQDLKSTEDILREFKVENHLINPEKEEEKIVSKYSEIEEKQILLSLEKNYLIWLHDYIKENKDIRGIAPFIEATSLSVFNTKLEHLISLEERKKELLLSHTENSPAVKMAMEKINDYKQSLLKVIENSIDNYDAKNKYDKSQVYKYENLLETLPEKEAEFMRLNRLSSIKEKFYLMLLDKRSEFAIIKEGTVSNKVILKKAEINTTPLSPNKNIIWFIGFATGGLLSLLMIFIRYLANNKIFDVNQLENHCKANILGAIPSYSKNKMQLSKIVVTENTRSSISEAFRSIRTNLQFIQSGNESKIIAVTSTISGEGKTFIALNLAGIYSITDKKTIILDFDMRNPKIHHAFCVSNEKGMSTIFIGKDHLKDCIHHSQWENIDFITSGPIPPNPAELINSPTRDEILNELKKKYDYIIIDTPPVGIVVDALQLLKISDYPIYVVRANYSENNFINNINKISEENNIHKLSVILNSIGEGGNTYGYGYGYGYGYYSDSPIKKKSLFRKFF